MPSYYPESPVSRLLGNDSFLLSGGRFQDPETRKWNFTEVTMYVDYNAYEYGISLSIFDAAKHEYTLPVTRYESLAPLEAKLSEVLREYPRKFSKKKLLEKARVYFAGAGESLFLDDKVTDFQSSCEQCGDYNVDTYQFYYFPAVEGSFLSEASLELEWRYGCFGGQQINGSFEDKADEVLELLKNMLNSAEDPYKDGIRQAFEVVQNNMK